MARIILEPGEEMTFSSNVPGIINGYADSSERIRISDGSTVTFDATFNGGDDVIEFDGVASNFQISLDGAQAVITSDSDDVAVRIPVGQATQLVFAGGAPMSLQVNGQGQPVLGDQVLTGTPADISGGNTLELDADTTIGLASTTITGFDTVVLGSRRDEDDTDGHVYSIALDDDNAPASGSALVIDASALAADGDGAGPMTDETLTLDASAVTAYDLVVIGGAGFDIVTLGEGDDTVDMGTGFGQIFAYDNLTSADVLDGGPDNAGLFVSGNVGDEALAQVTNMRIFMLDEGSTLTLGANASANNILGAGDNSAGATTLDASDFTSSESFAITMGAGADVVILGDTQRNQLIYNSSSESSLDTGRDTISNFRPGIDIIYLPFLDVADGLTNIAFRGNVEGHAAAEAALDNSDNFLDVVFDTQTGVLWADADDNGVLDGSDLSLVLVGTPALTAGDVGDGSMLFNFA